MIPFPLTAKNLNLYYKLALCEIADIEKAPPPFEAATDEFPSTKATSERKLYNDKLKSVLVFKCHLNSLLKKLVYLPQIQASSVPMPTRNRPEHHFVCPVNDRRIIIFSAKHNILARIRSKHLYLK